MKQDALTLAAAANRRFWCGWVAQEASSMLKECPDISNELRVATLALLEMLKGEMKK